MSPDFLVKEITVRQSGESQVFDCAEPLDHNLLLTLNIAHAVEHESLELDVYGSRDGVSWSRTPLLSLPPKSYCGTYKTSLAAPGFRYFKAVWRVNRWSGDRRPFFCFHIFVEAARVHAMAGAA
jgi:hypothetical protein